MKKLLLMMLGVLMALPAMADNVIVTQFDQYFEYTYEGQTIKYNVISEKDKTVQTRKSGYDTLWGWWGGNKVSGDLILPDTVYFNGVAYTLTKIGNGSFRQCSGLTSVTIPSSVETIESSAFKECTGLTSVTIPSSVETIGSYAFSECTRLKSVTIPSLVETIGSFTFYKCTGLTSVTIPSSVKTIDSKAFCGCSRLTSVTIPSSVKTIGMCAFEECTGLTSVTFSNSVNTIENFAFYGCSGLTEIINLSESPGTMSPSEFKAFYETVELKIPGNLVEEYLITDWSFFKNISIIDSETAIVQYSDGVLNYRLIPALNNNGENLAVVIKGDYNGEIAIPERFSYTTPQGDNVRYYVKSIGYRAFANSAISKIDFNSRINLNSIGNEAFLNCKGLSSITIPSTVELIGQDAFYGCNSLTELKIPNSVKTIGTNAFYGCNSLSNTEFASIESLCSIDFENEYANPLSQSRKLYINGEVIRDVVIPESVSTIGNYAFYSCESLSSVTIGKSVLSIGESAFRCLFLHEAHFASVESLCSIEFKDAYANPLYYANKLYVNGEEIRDVVIPESVSTIGDYAFYNCSQITSLTIPESVSTIGDYAFYNCSQITSLTIPESVSTIGDYAFYDCRRITSLTIPSTVYQIGSYSFSNLKKLESLYFSVSKIGTCAFSECTGLTSIKLGNNVQVIDPSVFRDCTSLSELTIDDGDTPISLSGYWLTGITKLYMGREIDIKY